MAFNRSLFDVLDRHNGSFDALIDDWPDNWFCNPPYNEIKIWIEKMHGNGIALLPARTDTKWFHDHVMIRAAEIRFIKGRLKFGGAKNSAPFPSMLVIFKTGDQK